MNQSEKIQTGGEQSFNELQLEKKEKLSEGEIEKIILNRFEKINSPIKKLPETLKARLRLLERHSFINNYAEMVSTGAGNILTKIYEGKKEELSEWKLLITKLAGLIHDIGKSGPADASPEQQLAVIKLYAIEVIGIAKESIERIVRENFKDDADQMISNLESCGVQKDLSMRDFWDMHITWGHEILEGYKEKIPLEAIRIASLHHAYKDLSDKKYNPLIDGIPEEDLPIENMLDKASVLGILEEYLLVVIFDQYEAFVNRSGLEHKEAVKRVRSGIPKEFLEKYPKVKEILDKMEETKQAEIFKK